MFDRQATIDEEGLRRWSRRREIIDYYEQVCRGNRLAAGASLLEFERTKEILLRLLPKPPARIVDVGGAAGVYSAWLADLGYEVHLVDASERLIVEARKVNATLSKPIASVSVADARQLPQPDNFADVVLVMGPLYHLTVEDARMKALREARRVLKSSGLLVVAAISRYASASRRSGSFTREGSGIHSNPRSGPARRSTP